MPWETLFNNADEAVTMQLDLGNAMHGGGDPIKYLNMYPGRSRTIHLKEWTADDEGAIIGQGVVPWKQVFDLCERTGNTEWYIVENEGDPAKMPAMERVKACIDALKAMGK